MEKVSSLYIHFPFCKNCCNYCDFHKKKFLGSEQLDVYENLLSLQYDKVCELMASAGGFWRPLETLYIGGGTPSVWSYRGIEYLQSLKEKLPLAPECEFTLEVNPEEFSKEELLRWQEIGVNRISMGVQSLSAKHLKLLDRSCELKQALRAMEMLAESGINYSIDLLQGIPASESRNILEELKEALKYHPHHLSLYVLTVNSDYRRIRELPSDELIAKEYLECAAYLKDHGFSHYEVSNFALQSKESRHNLQYWQSASVGALGPGATGLLVVGSKALRYKWGQDSKPLLEHLNCEEFALERLYMRLRTNLGTFVGPEAPLEHWYQKGYLEQPLAPVRLTSQGYLLLDSLINDLF